MFDWIQMNLGSLSKHTLSLPCHQRQPLLPAFGASPVFIEQAVMTSPEAITLKGHVSSPYTVSLPFFTTLTVNFSIFQEHVQSDPEEKAYT